MSRCVLISEQGADSSEVFQSIQQLRLFYFRICPAQFFPTSFSWLRMLVTTSHDPPMPPCFPTDSVYTSIREDYLSHLAIGRLSSYYAYS